MRRWWRSFSQEMRSADGRPRALVDAAVALLVGALSLVDVASASAERLPGERPADGLAYALVVVAGVSLIWRRRAPIGVLTTVTVAVAIYWLRDHGAFLSALGLPALFAAAAHAERRVTAWVAMPLAVVVLMVTASFGLLDDPDGYEYLTALSMFGFLVGAIAAGLVVRNRERIFVDTERRAAEAEADRLAEAERAVASERSRIAREMHDVVAHSMSVVAVQAAAGREIVHADPHKAEQVFARIEAVGRESLTELRRMLGVLRELGDESASLAPQPGVADIADAVEQSNAAGVATDLVVDGQQRTLPAGVELTVFRIVQEALTNVRKHAGRSATATVSIRYETHAVFVEVVDDGRGAATSLSGLGSGHGLLGMRERVEIYGGELHAGPRHGGGFAVRASLPLADGGGQQPPPLSGAIARGRP
jgi:signal transduction histidine kinase